MSTNMQCRQMCVAVMMMVTLAIAATGFAGVAQYSTPAQVLAAYEKAHDTADDVTAVDCLSPEGLDKGVKFMIGMEMGTRQVEPGAPPPSPEEKKSQAEMDALLAKYGVKDLATRPGEEGEAYVNRITSHVTDRRTLLIKMMQMGETAGTKHSPCRKGELKDMKITGDSASGKYAVKEPDGSESSQDLEFKKIDGSWRLADVVMLVDSDTSDPAGAATTKPAKP